MNVIENRRGRFKDAPWFPEGESITPVLIGGAGGIGSWLTLLLSRAGFYPLVYDFDTLEEHNLGGQLYPDSAVGQPKVEALSKVVQDFSGTEINYMNEKFTIDSMTDRFMFSGFDNMTARRAMYEAWYKELKANPEGMKGAIFIDGRLTMEQLTIICITEENAERYQEYLFDDSEIEEAPCTMKQTSHTAAMIAGHMVSFFTNHLSNLADPLQKRKVPLYWEYFTPIDILTRES